MGTRYRNRRDRKIKKPPGQIRRSQLLTTYGPGALVDLPKHSVIVGGLDHGFWRGVNEEIEEPRLQRYISRIRGKRVYLKAPPASEDGNEQSSGVSCFVFPEWVLTDVIPNKHNAVRTRILVNRRTLDDNKTFILQDPDVSEKPIKLKTTPVRFVRACRCGHIGDIDWHIFVHQSTSSCRATLYMDEHGTSGDLSELTVRCSCGARRKMNTALSHGKGTPLGFCDGNQPWLGKTARADCKESNRLLVKSASNAYFPQLASVISIPESTPPDVQYVQDNLGEFEEIETAEDIESLLGIKKKLNSQRPASLSSEEIFKLTAKLKNGESVIPDIPIKHAEFATLTSQDGALETDKPESNFLARTLPRNSMKGLASNYLERVVLVHRLREVYSLLGFTRFESPTTDKNGELDLEVVVAPISNSYNWVPTIENRGEGIFLEFKSSEILKWREKTKVKERGLALLEAFKNWQEEFDERKKAEFMGLPYIMLHSLSHLLIQAISLECGYPASSLKERIYALEDPSRYGILIYTSASDSEGTLGGLVEAGKRIDKHLRKALELGELCSNDPVCAQHVPFDEGERRFLHGAACHGCLLIAEPSCEMHNEFLDRALVVHTVENVWSEFFAEAGA